MFCSVVPQNTVESPIEDHLQHTHTWYSAHGLVAFATSLDWAGVQGLNSEFSRGTCHRFGKVKEVLTPQSSVVAQDERDNWFHKYVSSRHGSSNILNLQIVITASSYLPPMPSVLAMFLIHYAQ